ncbi:hypothetical protein KORDIASMS9_04725 [Kordia sp. SMS9]|uniref:DUF2059 domain-containing protein n=1 Tax=Kordia sp. SMS9 TaxID=2282170 RepID=UPI000E0D6B1F|nr:DUF2059 domain-containing protein [Kordia sp. SMS9]AXG72451.1 hypothetical protein KORDIASMS9_04725 [Kordia sp. SMS9]
MKKIMTAAFLFVGIHMAFAQNDPYIESVKKYLTINGTQQQYEGAIDGMFEMLKKRFKDYTISEAIWTELESEKQKHVEEVKSILVSAYKAYFTLNDIKNMTAFYESDAVKQMLADKTKLTDTQRQQIVNFYNSDTGLKMIDSREGLAKIEGEISQQWSGELYKSVINKLAAKGYSLN